MRALIALGLLACAAVSAAQDAPRLVTHNIVFPDQLAGGAQAPERLSGYFKLNRTYDARLFFFFFESRSSPETAPVVLWMTGGPGCSSELAVFYENGPFSINADLSLNETRFGWDRNHNMIFVDQPVNTGFSYSADDRDRCYDEKCVSDDMLDFLVEFMKARPELADRDFYVTGESYAGHYVPAVSSRILHATKSGELSRPIKLRGMAIGNGLVDPAIQYGAYAPYAYQEGLISKGLRDRILMLYPACRVALEVCDGINWSVECKLAVAFCQATQFAPVMAAIPDYRKDCIGPLCYDFSRMEEYLNQPSVRKALGVGDRHWEACSEEVHSDMMGDWGHNFDTVIPELLHAGVQVMVYAGNKDIICNVEGNRRWVDALPWEGSAKWAAAKAEIWEVEGTSAGSVREADNLSFVEVFSAGHMVPMDQPEAALDMITRFTRGKPLAEEEEAFVKEEKPLTAGPGTTGRPFLREQ